MQQLYKEEFKKIFTYKMNKVAMIFLLIWILLISMMTGLQETLIVDMNSPRINGKEAIELQQKEFSKNKGILSEEKINSVLENVKGTKNSISISDEDARANLYSQGFIKDRELLELLEKTLSTNKEIDQSKNIFLETVPINFYQKWKEKAIKQVEVSESSLSYEQAKRNIQDIDNFIYDYSGGWQMLMKRYDDLMLGVLIILAICLSNIFSEDKEQNVSPILFSAKLGRKRYAKLKIKAAVSFASLIYMLSVVVYACGMLYVYGTTGGNASVQLGIGAFYADNMTNMQAFTKIVFLGYIASIFMTFITLTLSSITKSFFKTSIITILLCLVPFLLISYNGTNTIYSCLFPITLTDLNNVIPTNYFEILSRAVQGVYVYIIIILFMITCMYVYVTTYAFKKRG